MLHTKARYSSMLLLVFLSVGKGLQGDKAVLSDCRCCFKTERRAFFQTQPLSVQLIAETTGSDPCGASGLAASLASRAEGVQGFSSRWNLCSPRKALRNLKKRCRSKNGAERPDNWQPGTVVCRHKLVLS